MNWNILRKFKIYQQFAGFLGEHKNWETSNAQGGNRTTKRCKRQKWKKLILIPVQLASIELSPKVLALLIICCFNFWYAQRLFYDQKEKLS